MQRQDGMQMAPITMTMELYLLQLAIAICIIYMHQLLLERQPLLSNSVQLQLLLSPRILTNANQFQTPRMTIWDKFISTTHYGFSRALVKL